VFLSKITADHLSMTTILVDIDKYIEKETSAKIRSSKKMWVINDLGQVELKSLSRFAQRKMEQKTILLKNVPFFHPGNLTEGSDANHQYHFRALVSEVLLSHGYTEADVKIFINYIFAELFQNIRRKQVKCVFKEYSRNRWVELSKQLSEMESKHLIPNDLAIKISIKLMSEGFTFKIYSPRMDEHEEARYNEKVKTIKEVESNPAFGDSNNRLSDDMESRGYGLFVVLSALKDINPAYYFSLENKGKYAVTEITLPETVKPAEDFQE